MNNFEQPGENLAESIRHELESLQSQWWCFLALGISLVVLGMVAVSSSFFVSLVTVVFFGVLMLIGGLAQVISSFWAGNWSGTLLHLLIGVLYVVVGFFLIDSPLEGAAAITLVIAAFFIVGGVFRIVAALQQRFHDWPWVLLSGVISLLLGVLIYRQWPASGAWVIGLFVGIEMIFNGWMWIMLSLGLRSFRRD